MITECELPGVQVDVEAKDAQSAHPVWEEPLPFIKVISQSQREGQGEAAVWYGEVHHDHTGGRPPEGTRKKMDDLKSLKGTKKSHFCFVFWHFHLIIEALTAEEQPNVDFNKRFSFRQLGVCYLTAL